MIAALDVYYTDATARAAAVVWDGWESVEICDRFRVEVSPIADYEPGTFYKRELAPLLRVVDTIDLSIDTYVIDGYCHLSADLEPGLGAHFYEALGQTGTVVGVAKNRFRKSEHAVEVYRAGSSRPLFVTAIGMEYSIAAQHVQRMAGEFRIPAMLKAVDQLSRLSTD